MKNENWILCPLCRGKTRLKLREDTELKKFPLYCPKCKQETLINAYKDAEPITHEDISLWLSAYFSFIC